jgi:hypothetical protein
MDLPKPRSDSPLKTLSEERQEELAQYALDNSNKQTARWLCECGIPTSASAVSRFLAWYRTKQTLLRNQTVTETLVSEIAEQNPDLMPERLEQIGHSFFTSLALANQDHKAWYMTQQTALKNARLKLDTRKFQRVEARTVEDTTDKSKAGLTPQGLQEIEKKNNLC